MAVTLPTHAATRYLVPLREGGSLPAVVETDAGGLFVVKLRGAGQGAAALVAELIVGLLAAHLGLPVPELALIDVDPAFGRTEGDPEIQDLLRASHGLNVGLRYLDGAFNYDPLAGAALVTPGLAADVVWLDALVSNVDRTPRNPNLLVWHRGIWLIDHGAALYFHHHWPAVDDATPRRPFTHVKDHVLLPQAGDLRAADARLAGRIDAAVIADILALVPDDLIVPGDGGGFDSPDAARAAYARYLLARLEAPRAFVDEAVAARGRLAAGAGGRR